MLPANYRVHRQADATLAWRPVDSEGEPVAATGTPTATVERADGTSLTPVGSPTIATGFVNLPLTAAEIADVDRLTVTWSLDGVVRGVSTVDVVGGVYLTVGEIRDLEPSLTDPAEFSTAMLQRCRREAESRIERSVQSVSFVPRLSTFRFQGRGGGHAMLPHYFVSSVRWARYWQNGAWTSLDVSDATAATAAGVELLSDRFPWGHLVEIGYEHGLDVPPEDVKRVAALAVRYQALQNRSGLDSRAMSYQPTEGGNVILATAGVGPWEFGVPDIDGVLRSWREHYPTALVA